MIFMPKKLDILFKRAFQNIIYIMVTIRTRENNNTKFLGIVLNNLTNVLPYYYHESYYGYEYKPRAKAKS